MGDDLHHPGQDAHRRAGEERRAGEPGTAHGGDRAGAAGADRMTRSGRIAIGVALAGAVIAGAGWYWQSQIIGVGAQWYLKRIAAREEATGSLEERRQAVLRMHRML